MAKAESNLVSGLSGGIGNLVFVQTAQGIVVRARVIPHDPRTPAQAAMRRSMTQASALYKNLNTAQLLAWQAYADSLPPQLNAAGNFKPFRACDLFRKLALKFYQVTPGGAFPLLPPAVRFSGENVGISANVQARHIVFAADAPNSPNVVTEILLQKLANAIRKPSPKGYRSQGFHTFTNGGLALAIAVSPGIYIPAYRFVHAPTGQETPLVPLPFVEL